MLAFCLLAGEVSAESAAVSVRGAVVGVITVTIEEAKVDYGLSQELSRSSSNSLDTAILASLDADGNPSSSFPGKTGGGGLRVKVRSNLPWVRAVLATDEDGTAAIIIASEVLGDAPEIFGSPGTYTVTQA